MRIICFGDSNTYGYDPRGYFGSRYDHPWPEILAEKLNCTILNWGENGRVIPSKSINYPADTDLLIVMLGTNDLLQGESPDVVAQNMERFLEWLPSEKLLLISPPPMILGAWVPEQSLITVSKALADPYRSLAQRQNIRFVDAGRWNVPLAYDGVHLTQEGHRIFAEGLMDYMNKGE